MTPLFGYLVRCYTERRHVTCLLEFPAVEPPMNDLPVKVEFETDAKTHLKIFNWAQKNLELAISTMWQRDLQRCRITVSVHRRMLRYS